ncbi:MAG: SO_0444 family Cu/Zn efflux transporter [Phycisphaerales bacterium]|nr:SO_0444 family Cu/Zn efflux transporter [Phycisphaerales bacterium]
MTFMQAWWDAFWSLVLESGMWLVVGFALAGAMHALVPAGFLERHLAGRGAWPILKASLLGIPLPLCSCSVIPVAAGLRKGGASRGASAAFAISTPQTGEESIPLTWALFGPVYALTRPVVALVTAFAAGSLIEVFGGRKRATENQGQGAGNSHHACRREEESESSAQSCCGGKAAEPQPACGCGHKTGPAHACCSGHQPSSTLDCGREEPVESDRARCGGHGDAESAGSCCSTTKIARRDWGERIRAGLRHGFVTMPVDLAPWLAIGLVLAAAVTAAVPAGWIENNIGTGIGAMLLMLLIGIPLYICATSSTPLAYTLVAAGLSPGAALVLLLAGPATNTATIAWALKDLGVKATAIYLGTIAVVSVAAGVVFDALLSHTVRLAEAGGLHEHGGMGPAYVVGAVLFTMLLGWSLVMRVNRSLKQKPGAASNGACCAHGHRRG